MKRSHKGALPQSVKDWIRSEKEIYNENPAFDALRAPEKDELRRVLMREQGFLCAYCGRSLASNFSDSHVDHFWPQAVFDGRTHQDDRRLEHGNLFQSCGPASLPGMLMKFPHSTCGDAKGDWYDEERFVIPSDERCEERFVYDASGRIGAKDGSDWGAWNMIEALKLDHAALRNERKRVIQELERAFFSAGPDWGEVEREILCLRGIDDEGRQTGFAQVARRYLEEERDAGLGR